jgi:hypothetical protein
MKDYLNKLDEFRYKKPKTHQQKKFFRDKAIKLKEYSTIR